ncbi:putative bifunctional diguanylate cyclase/phosphodiesterase [Corallincola platygyrae]|uniref:Bifunctional diguanylate cyclase/phosphodiesterase n=1 Tax=Corallincola platygyrae TaxID=1193278 RepID=A0ABW4XIK1_9GAMM
MALHSGGDLSFRIFIKTLLVSAALAFVIWSTYVWELSSASYQNKLTAARNLVASSEVADIPQSDNIVLAFDTASGRVSAQDYLRLQSADGWKEWVSLAAEQLDFIPFDGIYWAKETVFYSLLDSPAGGAFTASVDSLLSEALPKSHVVASHLLAMVVVLPFLITFAMYRQRSKLSRQARRLASLAAKQAGLSSHYRLNNDNAAVIEESIQRLSKKLNEQKEAVSAAHFADKLTGLANRQQFQLALEKAIEEAEEGKQKLALLFVDLDGFKQVNDTFGHSVGDGLLVEVAKRLNAATRHSDVIALTAGGPTTVKKTLARLGGDEFTLILSNINAAEEAEHVSERIIELLEKEFRFGEQRVNISASIGIAVYPQDGQSPENLLQMADVAMYKAKSDGKGTYRVYLPEMGKEVRRQHYLSNEIRRAVNDGEFSLDFQPVIDINSDEVAYFEALLRWHHPMDGSISPAEFIPIAEETRQILPLGDFVLREAMRQMESWNRVGLRKARVSINVSNVQLKQLPLKDWVEKALKETKLPPRCLMLEITESYLMEASDEIIQQIEGLRELGVKIAIDDFGTGYSSLSSLASLPIDVLKIDRSFVNQAATCKKYRRILASIMVLAKQLELVVVAEGVETPEELALLKKLNCQYIQGYLLSRPQTAQKLNKQLVDKALGQLAAAGSGVML